MGERHGRGELVIGGALLVLLVGMALVGPHLVRADPQAVDLAARLAGPTAAHPLGRDALGRDLLARLCHGARLSLAIAGAATVLSVALGVAVGAVAGWFGGWVDAVLARVIDVVLAFPGLLLAIALAAVLGPAPGHTVIALTALGWTGYARLARAQVTSLKHRDFVAAARAVGRRDAAILVRHLLPLAAPLLLVQATFGLSGAVLAEASLSFLGLGTPPPRPSWGAMLDEGRLFMLVAPHVVVVPAVALALTVLGLQLAGDGLRDRLDLRDDG